MSVAVTGRMNRSWSRSRRYIGVDWLAGPKVDVVAPAEELPFEDGSFDLLLSAHVLEHVADPVRVVAEAGRVLRPGGSTASGPTTELPSYGKSCFAGRAVASGRGVSSRSRARLTRREASSHAL